MNESRENTASSDSIAQNRLLHIMTGRAIIEVSKKGYSYEYRYYLHKV